MPDVVRTRLELVNEALGVLLNLPAGATFSDEDITTVDGYIDPMLAELAADEVVYLAEPDEIPAEWFLSLQGLLASRAGPRYGGARDLEGEERHKNTLRRLTANKATYEVQRAEYY
jgi:hypothetical protein